MLASFFNYKNCYHDALDGPLIHSRLYHFDSDMVCYVGGPLIHNRLCHFDSDMVCYVSLPLYEQKIVATDMYKALLVLLEFSMIAL